MGKPTETDEYLPCLKCNVWVPVYAKAKHINECHQSSLESFSHPYITECSMFALVNIIGKSEQLKNQKGRGEKLKADKDKKSKKKGKPADEVKKKPDKEKVTEEKPSSGESQMIQRGEPEWLKKIFVAFHHRIVLVNERDLVRCNITAYTPVLVECGDVSCAFIAIPDENIKIGEASLHDKCLEKYIPLISNKSHIWIKKIRDIKFVDELEISTNKVLLENETKFISQQLKFLLDNNFLLGDPFTLCLGSKVYLPSNNNFYEISSFKLSKDCDENLRDESDNAPKSVIESDMIKKMTNLNIQSDDETESIQSKSIQSESIPSDLITLDYVASETIRDLSTLQTDFSDRNDSFNDTFVTLDEVNDSFDIGKSRNINLGSDLMTSTPKSKVNENQSNNVNTDLGDLSSIEKEANISNLRTNSKDPNYSGDPSQNSIWFRINKDTKITIHPSCIKQSKKKIEKCERYCEDHSYISLKKIMHSVLRNFGSLGNPLLGGWGGVLLYGPPGTGKTLMVKQAAEEFKIPIISLTLSDVTETAGSGEDCVRRTFKFACDSGPCILFLDEVDSLCPAGDQKIQKANDLTSAVVLGFNTLKDSPMPVFVVGASSRPPAIHPKLRSSGRLDRDIMVPLPDGHQRIAILSHLLSTQRHCLSHQEEIEVAKRAYGFSGADLSVLIRGAWLNCVERSKGANKPEHEDLCLRQEDLLVGLKGVVPTMLRHHYSALSLVKWCDIWGYHSIKSKLQRMVSEYMKAPTDHQLKGTLLYGPPGCSKTMIVRALATETGFTFFSLKCSDLLSKYVGETEKSLNQVFVRAQQACPALVFMDEVDSLCGERGGHGGSGGSGLVSELLTLMANCHAGVMIIASTNRPHVVDEALLRPGFLEQIIHVDLPDTESREEMWAELLRGIPSIGEPLDLHKLSSLTKGYSGAEITAIYQEAAHSVISQLSRLSHNISIPDLISSQPTPVSSQDVPISSQNTPVSSQDAPLSSQDIPSLPSKPFTQESEQENPIPVAISMNLLIKVIQASPPRTPASLLNSISSFSKQRGAR